MNSGECIPGSPCSAQMSKFATLAGGSRSEHTTCHCTKEANPMLLLRCIEQAWYGNAIVAIGIRLKVNDVPNVAFTAGVRANVLLIVSSATFSRSPKYCYRTFRAVLVVRRSAPKSLPSRQSVLMLCKAMWRDAMWSAVHSSTSTCPKGLPRWPIAQFAVPELGMAGQASYCTGLYVRKENIVSAERALIRPHCAESGCRSGSVAEGAQA